MTRPQLGLLAGVGIGLVDLMSLHLLGVEMMWQGTNLIVPVMGVFAATFAALGFVNGRLADARAEVRAQLQTVEQTQAEMLQVAKLASVGRMAASVAHEVRNPLAVIKSSAALLVESLPADHEDGRKAGRFIAEEIDRLDGFVRSLLDFSRPITPELGDHSLAEVAERVERLVSEPRRRTGAAVEIEVRGERAWPVDADLLARAVAAIATNACQAAGEGGRVRVYFDGDAGTARVTDDGAGIDDEIRTRLFEPFVTNKAKGTGLGLSVAARIAEVHGGVLEVVEGQGLGEAGRGACFELRLAALQEAA